MPSNGTGSTAVYVGLLIVVGSLTSDTMDEKGHPNRGHIGLTVR